MVEQNNSKESKKILNQALQVLEHAMILADEKDDLDAMIAISDRLMMLYQHLADKGHKKFKPGFAIVEKEKVKEDDESDQ
jgi:hypothetical protein